MPLTVIEVLQSTAVITTILQFLSGTLISKNYIQKKSTGESSGFPFICGFLSCSFWLRYGYLTDQDSLVLVNFIGVTLFFLYTLIYYVFTINKRMYLKQFLLILTILLTVCYYTSQLETTDEAVRLMGMVCCVVTVCFFAAPLTMLFHVIRVRNSESLPLPLIVMSFLVSLQWLVYGIIISDTFIQIPNFLGCLLSILQLFLFVVYPPKTFNGQGYKLVDQAVAF